MNFALKSQIPTEADECQCLLQWARVTRYRGLCLAEYLVMIPNRVKLSGDSRERAILMAGWKRDGFKAGASDYFLAIATPTHPGLWLEMKRSVHSVTREEQVNFQHRMRLAGYACGIAKGFEAARAMIVEYLR